jgi:signal transduction histidine kinase
MAVLSIVDRGRGIPEDETTKLTEPYYRAQNARGVHGTGLGLYVTARYVASHAGAMDIKSELGAGTTVTVRIPIKQTPVEDRRDATAHPLH